MYCTEFNFNGISSKEYDLMVCSFENSESGVTTAGSKIEYNTIKLPNSDTWDKTSAEYSEPLTIHFQVCKNSDAYNMTQNEREITERELAFLMRWLVRKDDYKCLKFLQNGYENICYMCKLEVQEYKIADVCYGLDITATCNAPFGYSPINTYSKTCTSSATCDIYDSSDEIGFVMPNVNLYITQDCNVSITNNMNGKELIINNCKNGEHIVMNNMLITSNQCISGDLGYTGTHTSLLDDFNYNWLYIGNTFSDRTNTLSLSGNFELELSWRGIRKAVL